MITSDTNSVKKWCDAQGIPNVVTNDESGEGWTKDPSQTKATEFTDQQWSVLENGSADFEYWASNNSWSWSNTINLFDKFKEWIAQKTYSITEKNLVYNGVVSDVADLERGATLKQMGKNFDEGKNLVGSENIIPAGYSSVTDKLVAMITSFPNCEIRLNEKVVKIATVVDQTSESGHRSTITLFSGAIYTAPRVVVSLPLGVLQAGTIAFEPNLSADKVNAIEKLGMGLLDKITLLYSNNFWMNDSNGLGRGTWFTVIDPTAYSVGVEPSKPQREFWNAAKYFNNKPVVTMLVGATTADDCEVQSDTTLVKIADDLFRSLWTDTSTAVVKVYTITRWRADEHARGAHSYLPPGATVQMRRDLCKYLNDGIYWAGEHCSIDYPATVHGAFDSGTSVANSIPRKSSISPTRRPTGRPTSKPSTKLTVNPSSLKPSSLQSSSLRPTTRPTSKPSTKPTAKPKSLKPSTLRPSSLRPSTLKPISTSSMPTPTSSKPTSLMLQQPTSRKPSQRPSLRPTRRPTNFPSSFPT